MLGLPPTDGDDDLQVDERQWLETLHDVFAGGQPNNGPGTPPPMSRREALRRADNITWLLERPSHLRTYAKANDLPVGTLARELHKRLRTLQLVAAGKLELPTEEDTHTLWKEAVEKGRGRPAVQEIDPATSTDPNVRYAGPSGTTRFLDDLKAGRIYTGKDHP